MCRGFFDSYRDRSRDLLILQAGRRLTEVPPPLVARAEQLGRDAGKAAASWVSGGNTPEEKYQRVLRGIAEGDPPSSARPSRPRSARSWERTGRPRPRPRHRARRPCLPRAMSAYAGAFTSAFWQETQRAARDHSG
jgi:hypothetical protein